nr:hypothetical protein [Escherichia coli]
MTRAEGWFTVFGRNGVMPGVPEVKFMGILTVYVLGGTEIYKKKRKKDYFFLGACVSFLVLRLFRDLLIRGFYKENSFYGF